MKSALVLLLTTLLMLSQLGAGQDRPAEPAEPIPPAESGSLFPPASRDIDFSAQYIRTDGYLAGAAYPQCFWVTSEAELSDYCAQNKDRYHLEGRFAEAAAGYDAAFFETHDLIVVLLEEGSGSVRHEVTALQAAHSHLDRVQYLLRPVIRRQVPEVGTCDMAQWHILIAVDKGYGQLHSELQAPVFR